MKRSFWWYLKISLLGAIVLFALTIGIATAWLYYNEDKIYALILDELNDNQQGYTEVGHIDVSPFQNFPYISIGIHDLRFYGDKEKSESPIYEIADVYAGFQLWDIIKGEYIVKKLKLSNGHLRLVLDEKGELNLSMAKSDGKEDAEEEEAVSSKLHLDLKAVEVHNVRISELNMQGAKYLNLILSDVDAQFSSVDDFIRIVFKGDLMLKEYTAGKTTFFKDKAFNLDTRFTYDVVSEFLIILPGKLVLDYGYLDFSGNIDFLNNLNLDLEVYGQKENFDAFISFAPNEVAENLNRFRNEGDIYFKGTIRGPSINADPAIDIELSCENTFFFHKDESKAVKDVAFNGRFHTGAKNSLETSEFTLTKLYGVPETGEFSGSFKVVNFVNPIVSIDFHADVELENFQSFYDPDWLIDAGGNLRVDITINEFVDQDSVIHVASQLEDGTLSRIEFKNAWMQLADYHHKLEDMQGKIILDGDNLLLEKLYSKVGESDLLVTARLGHLNDLMHKQPATVDFSLHLESDKIDVASLLPKEMAAGDGVWKTEVLTDFSADFDLLTSVKSLETYKYFPEAELTIREFSGQLEGYAMPLKEVSGKIKTSDERIDIDNLTVKIGDNDLHLNLLIDDPQLFMETNKRGAAHFHTSILADEINFKELLYYRGKPLLDPEIQAELGEERIRNLHFECDGYVHPSTISPNGLKAYCNLEKFTVKLNDLPELRDAKGLLRADTTGCLHIEDFSASLGRSDYYADLQLLHLLDTLGDKREIYGSIGGTLWELDEYFAQSSTTPAAAPVDVATTDSTAISKAHQVELNIFALPFPKMNLTVDVGKIIHERYELEDLHGHFKASPDHMVWIDTLHFQAAGGHIGIGGYLNGSVKDDLYLTGTLELQDVDIDQVFFKMDNFGQDYLVSNQLHGRMSGTIKTKAHLYPDLSPMLDRTEAEMNIKITDGRLENFSPMQAMGDFMGDRNLNNIRFAEMENAFDYRNGTLIVPRMKIASTLGYIHLSGKQSMDDKIDYEIQVPLSLVKSAGWNMMKSKLASSKKKSEDNDLKEVEEEIISEQSGLIRKYMTFKVTGTVDDFDVGMGKNKKLKDLP